MKLSPHAKPRLSMLVAALALATVSTVQAHHSPAAFDTSTEVTFTGTVTSYSFRNPHVYMEVERQLENGETMVSEIEAGAASVIGPLGFTRDSVKVGDVINVIGNPGKRNPEALMMGKELYKSDGTYYPLNISSRPIEVETPEPATSIAGTWFAPRTSFFGILGAVNGWPVTEKGEQSKVANGQNPTPQKDCIPLGEPALLFYPVANVIEVFDDRVEMHIDWLDSERVIWLDGREHPPASETFQHGHSVGHFEGTTLVVDSANYSANPIGFSISLASGTGKHLSERFELGEDGLHMIYSGTVEDPEYLREPVTWSGRLDYRPDMQMSNEVCDFEAAQRFLDD